MLNIKNKQTYKLAQELSKLTGLSMTSAVTEALSEKLAQVKTLKQKKRTRVANELLKISERLNSTIKKEA